MLRTGCFKRGAASTPAPNFSHMLPASQRFLLVFAVFFRPASTIKCLMSLLRYSGHDSDVFLNFTKEFTSQCVHPYLNPRTEHDLISDLEEAFANWYKLKKGEDVADVCGHICMRLGRCDKALKFLQVI